MELSPADVLRTLVLANGVAFFIILINRLFRIYKNRHVPFYYRKSFACNKLMSISYCMWVVYSMLVTFSMLGQGLTVKAPLAFVTIGIGIIGLIQQSRSES